MDTQSCVCLLCQPISRRLIPRVVPKFHEFSPLFIILVNFQGKKSVWLLMCFSTGQELKLVLKWNVWSILYKVWEKKWTHLGHSKLISTRSSTNEVYHTPQINLVGLAKLHKSLHSQMSLDTWCNYMGTDMVWQYEFAHFF